MKHAVNNRDFIFQSFWRWLVMNLVTLNHDYSQLISFDIEVGYWKLSFQETQVNLIGLLEKPDIMFPSRIFKNGIL